MLPETVKRHLLAKHEIMDDCIEKVGLDDCIYFVEDPRGVAFEVRLDYTTRFVTNNQKRMPAGQKEEIKQVRTLSDGTVLIFESVG